MEENNRISLANEKAKIVCARLITRMSMLTKMIIAYLLFMLIFDKFNLSQRLGQAGLLFVVFLFLLPFIVHILYLVLTKFGYVVFYDDHAKICTKTSTKSFSYYNSLKFEIKGYCLLVRKPEPDYYSVKMIFEENGEIKKIRLYTDDLKLFSPLAAKFKKAD